MQKPALFDRAKEAAPQGGGFQRADVKKLVPEAQRDVVDRIVAAGMRYLYSPEMRQEVMQALQAQEPIPQKIGANAAGLILTLDNQMQGGIPMDALFPAALELVGEAAEVVEKAGQPVTQEDYNAGCLVAMAILAKKLGADDQQITQAFGGQDGEDDEGEEEVEDEQEPDDADDEEEGNGMQPTQGAMPGRMA